MQCIVRNAVAMTAAKPGTTFKYVDWAALVCRVVHTYVYTAYTQTTFMLPKSDYYKSLQRNTKLWDR